MYLSLRHAAELRWLARAGDGSHATGRIRRPSVRLRQSAERPGEDSLLGSRWFCRMGQAVGGRQLRGFGKGDEPSYEITAQELGALLSGIDLSVARRQKRYQRK